MSDERRTIAAAWLTGGASTGHRPLATALPNGGPRPAESWLTMTPAASAPVAEVATACGQCAELAGLRAELTAAQQAAAEQGREEGRAETASLRARLVAVVDAVAGVRTAGEAALTETIVDVALGLCEWLAPAAAAIDRRALAPLVAQALAAGGNRDLILRLNGDDAAELGTQVPAGVVCEVVADLAPGEVYVEAPRLVVDARWPTRLAALREPLLALIRAANPGLDLAVDDRRAGDHGGGG